MAAKKKETKSASSTPHPVLLLLLLLMLLVLAGLATTHFGLASPEGLLGTMGVFSVRFWKNLINGGPTKTTV
jgi:hypothetical protein